MPAGLEKIKKAVWDRLSGKTNPRTKKPYTESDAYAIATAQYKRKGLSVCLSDDYEDEEDIMNQAINGLIGEEETQDAYS